MPENEQLRPVPVFSLLGAVATGAASARWIPPDWFLHLLGYSILIALVLLLVATIHSKNERRPPTSAALMLELFWLPSRNADVEAGPVLRAFFCVAAFVAGILAYALSLPLFT